MIAARALRPDVPRALAKPIFWAKAHLATLSNMHTQCRRRLVARAEIVVQILPQDFERIVIGRQAGLFTAQNQAVALN